MLQGFVKRSLPLEEDLPPRKREEFSVTLPTQCRRTLTVSDIEYEQKVTGLDMADASHRFMGNDVLPLFSPRLPLRRKAKKWGKAKQHPELVQHIKFSRGRKTRKVKQILERELRREIRRRELEMSWEGDDERQKMLAELFATDRDHFAKILTSSIMTV